jgi:hypothetical protein
MDHPIDTAYGMRGDDIENQSVNPSSNPAFDDVVAAARSRRGFLKSGAGAAALAFFGVPALTTPTAARAVAGGAGATLGFASVPSFGNDTVVLPPGYNLQVLFAWGDPIGKAGVPAGQPAWSGDASESAAEQELQSGAHHDGMHFFPFPARGAGSTAGLSNVRGLLAMNHEYVDQGLLYNDGMANWSLAKVRKSQAAHGVTVIEVIKNAAGWQVVRPSNYARRITANTPVKFSGPAVNATGTDGFGTLNNCAHGYTPWGTYITCEENWNGYFGATRLNATTGAPENDTTYTPTALDARYGVNAGGFGYNWHHYDPRFDLKSAAGGQAETKRFGWVVEIDPFNPNAAPIKRTALGRFKHEGAEFTLAADGRAVIYSGDDQANEYIYKFVSKNKFVANNRAANLNLLDEGTLYAARFEAGAAAGDNMGNGVWLPLTLDNPVLAAEFATLGDLLVNARRAADLAGATRMDRPEWVAVNPTAAGEVYCALTNNSGRTTADEANPRTVNRYGHIIRWQEAGADPAAITFEWDIFVLAGDPTLPANAGTPQAGNINGDYFGSPDGLWFDKSGRLWIQTDISTSALGLGSGVGGYANMPNNMMLAANTVSGEVRRFLTGPKGCEVTGVITTPDQKTMFVNIQHPGEGASDNSNPADPLYPNRVSAWPSSQGYGFQGPTGDDKTRPRSGTIVITRADGGVIGA